MLHPEAAEVDTTSLTDTSQLASVQVNQVDRHSKMPALAIGRRVARCHLNFMYSLQCTELEAG